MAQKFHIDKNGKPAICKARKRPCPLGGENMHFDSIEEAQAYIDEQNKEEFGLFGTSENKNEEKVLFNPYEYSPRHQGILDDDEVYFDIHQGYLDVYPDSEFKMLESDNGGWRFSIDGTRYEINKVDAWSPWELIYLDDPTGEPRYHYLPGDTDKISMPDKVLETEEELESFKISLYRMGCINLRDHPLEDKFIEMQKKLKKAYDMKAEAELLEGDVTSFYGDLVKF